MGKNRVCMIVVLTIFLLLSLVACGQNDRIDSGALVYVPEEVKFSSPLTWTESACVSGEVVYLLGAVCDSKTYEETLTARRRSSPASTPPGWRELRSTSPPAAISAPARTGRCG